MKNKKRPLFVQVYMTQAQAIHYAVTVPWPSLKLTTSKYLPCKNKNFPNSKCRNFALWSDSDGDYCEDCLYEVTVKYLRIHYPDPRNHGNKVS